MAYIESHQSLLAHRKTIRACALLKVNRYLFLGHLHALWWWGLDNADADGRLGDVQDEELAGAAGFPEKKANEFVLALETARFIDRDPESGQLIFHNWRKYTWRFYDLERERQSASESGSFGNHKRWHVDRGIRDESCQHCIGSIAPTVAPIRPDTSPRIGGDHRPESLLSLSPPNKQPTSQSSSQTLRARLAFTPEEIAKLRSLFPTADINAREREWVSWIEEEESRRFPEKKLEAFIGWLKKDDGSENGAAVQLIGTPRLSR